MQASTIERPSSTNCLTKPHPQKEVKNIEFFTFTAEDLYNCLHKNSGKVEPVDLEESKFKKLKENFTGAETHPSCKYNMLFCSRVFLCLLRAVFVPAFNLLVYPEIQYAKALSVNTLTHPVNQR